MSTYRNYMGRSLEEDSVCILDEFSFLKVQSIEQEKDVSQQTIHRLYRRYKTSRWKERSGVPKEKNRMLDILLVG